MSAIQKFLREILLGIGSQGISLSITFLFAYTYLSYWTITDISLSNVIYYTKEYSIYLWLAVFFYLLHMNYILTYTNMNKICKKYNVTVIK